MPPGVLLCHAVDSNVPTAPTPILHPSHTPPPSHMGLGPGILRVRLPLVTCDSSSPIMLQDELSPCLGPAACRHPLVSTCLGCVLLQVLSANPHCPLCRGPVTRADLRAPGKKPEPGTRQEATRLYPGGGGILFISINIIILIYNDIKYNNIISLYLLYLMI
jgi:hypothetical protein